jgi:hypothetical protein
LKFPPYDVNEKLFEELFFQKQNENGGMNLQKNQESKKKSVPSCQYNLFSNIGSTMHCRQVSKVDAGHVDFLIRTKLIGL